MEMADRRIVATNRSLPTSPCSRIWQQGPSRVSPYVPAPFVNDIGMLAAQANIVQEHTAMYPVDAIKVGTLPRAEFLSSKSPLPAHRYGC
jgi:hypothetical protein